MVSIADEINGHKLEMGIGTKGGTQQTLLSFSNLSTLKLKLKLKPI